MDTPIASTAKLKLFGQALSPLLEPQEVSRAARKKTVMIMPSTFFIIFILISEQLIC